LGDAVGLDGSIMMPAFSGEMSDPATWLHPPVPPDWIEIIRRETPIYDPRLTPTRLMGTVAELFRTYPGVRRSSHPHSSFAACGRYADVIAGTHPLDFRFGSASPLGKLAALDGKVLLLGADTRRGSFIYLAQYLSGLGARGTKVVPVADGSGGVMWRTCHDVIYSNRYVQTGIEFLMAEGVARVSAVGDAPTVLMPVRESLAALLDWGWKTADVPHEVLREPVPLPARWEEWLQTESLGDA
jgi:aminoglycoside 3-N-acetyltransferase